MVRWHPAYLRRDGSIEKELPDQGGHGHDHVASKAGRLSDGLGDDVKGRRMRMQRGY